MMGLYKRGKVWWMCFSWRGRQIRRSTETKDKKLAEKIYIKVLTEVTERKWFERPKGENITIREMMEKYMKTHSLPNKASSERDRTSLTHIEPFFGDYTLAEIGPDLIDEYKQKRRAEGASPCSINRELALMKHAFNLAITRWKWTRENPIKGMMEKEPPERDRYLSYEEEDALLKVSPEWLKEIIVFALETGCRQGEILSLTWRDIDLSKRIVNVFGKKTGERRAIPLSTRALELLKEKSRVRHLKTNFVFVLKGKGINRYTLSDNFKGCCKKTGITDFRFHDLRHTAATRWAQAGVDPYAIQKLLGHTSFATTKRYAHHCVDSLRRALDVFERTREESLSQFYYSDSKPHRTFLSQKAKNP